MRSSDPFDGAFGWTPELVVLEYILALGPGIKFDAGQVSIRTGISLRDVKRVLHKYEDLNLVRSDGASYEILEDSPYYALAEAFAEFLYRSLLNRQGSPVL